MLTNMSESPSIQTQIQIRAVDVIRAILLLGVTSYMVTSEGCVSVECLGKNASSDVILVQAQICVHGFSLLRSCAK